MDWMMVVVFWFNGVMEKYNTWFLDRSISVVSHLSHCIASFICISLTGTACMKCSDGRLFPWEREFFLKICNMTMSADSCPCVNSLGLMSIRCYEKLKAAREQWRKAGKIVLSKRCPYRLATTTTDSRYRHEIMLNQLVAWYFLERYYSLHCLIEDWLALYSTTVLLPFAEFHYFGQPQRYFVGCHI
jgi:hypothetical protein